MSQNPIMSRARLYVLLAAFEQDVRAILSRYVVSELGEDESFGASYEAAATRRTQDATSDSETPLVNFLDLRPAYDLLNTHRQILPHELSVEVRELTQSLDSLVAIRNRVMHSRPLAPGDSDLSVSLLSQFTTRYWAELKRILQQLNEDPDWEPIVAAVEQYGFALHNLPLPDYDETGLLGRETEVSELVALIKRGREHVITITGEGGIGKTALALEVAFRIVDDETQKFDAVLWTSLKHERLTAEGVRTIAGAARDIMGAIQPLGRTLDAGFSGSIQDLSSILAGLRVLIVVDNLETIGGPEFSHLYDSLPDDTYFLVTSRLGVGEFERRYPLAPLSAQASLQLFNDFVRVRRISGLDRLSASTRREVVERLRYSPLAIKWFAMAVEAGNEPLQLLRHQDELLEYCVRSVYASLEPQAREVLAGLAVLARPVTVDEMVLLLQKTSDQISVGLQDLLRGSLVRRESASEPGTLALRIALTETARQFLARRVAMDDKFENDVARRENEFRQAEERRASDLAKRSLAPVVVRSRNEADAPTCQLLRRALLASKNSDFAAAFKEVEQARRLNPDFWEVDRVEGYIRAAAGDYLTATARYKSAYGNSDGPDRAVVAHFYAGHLARNIRDVSSAIRYAEEAHQTLQLDDTAVALGSYYVWTHRFTEGIELIEPVAARHSEGRARLIAVNGLASAYRRWAEAAWLDDRNPLMQHLRAKQGLQIALAALESGVADNRLRSMAAQCATEAIVGASRCISASTLPPKFSEWISSLTPALVRFAGTREMGNLLQALAQLCQLPGAPVVARRLLQAATQIDVHAHGEVATIAPAGSTYEGEVVSIRANYGFIRHPRFASNLFFHADDVSDPGGFGSLNTGSLVRFGTEQSDRGPRANGIHRLF